MGLHFFSRSKQPDTPPYPPIDLEAARESLSQCKGKEQQWHDLKALYERKEEELREEVANAERRCIEYGKAVNEAEARLAECETAVCLITPPPTYPSSSLRSMQYFHLTLRSSLRFWP